MRILVDTNVLLRLAQPLQQPNQMCRDAIEALQRQGHDLFICPQVLYELWVVATRPIENNGLGLSPERAQIELAAAQQVCRLLADDSSVFVNWHELVTSLGIKGKQAHDARIVAAMKSHSVSHLLTINSSDFKRYSSISTLLPADIANGLNPS